MEKIILSSRFKEEWGKKVDLVGKVVKNKMSVAMTDTGPTLQFWREAKGSVLSCEVLKKSSSCRLLSYRFNSRHCFFLDLCHFWIHLLTGWRRLVMWHFIRETIWSNLANWANADPIYVPCLPKNTEVTTIFLTWNCLVTVFTGFIIRSIWRRRRRLWIMYNENPEVFSSAMMAV